MTQEDGTKGGAAEREIVRLLKVLAAPGGKILRDGETGQALLCAPTREPRPLAEGLLRSLSARGLLCETERGHLSLSGAGRQTLRRLLSGGGFQEQHREMTVEPRPSPTGDGDVLAGINLAESPLAWLAKRCDRNGKKLLDRAQVEAGERLRADYSFARLMPSMTGGWRVEPPTGQKGSSGGGGADMTDDVLAARKRVERVLGALQPVLAGVLIDVCCHLKGLEAVEAERGWPARSAKIVLQIALDGLADGYGYKVRAAEGSGRIVAQRRCGNMLG